MPVTPQIVIVDATVTEAPLPSTLQQSGALVSVGGTTVTAGTYLFCANLAAVTAVLSGSGNSAEIGNMATTFFAQSNGSSAGPVGVYVLELGASGGVAATQITSLQTWITANSSPQQFYAYLTPFSWDTTTSAALNTMAANYDAANGKTYFFVTTTSAHLSAYATTKSVYANVTSPTAAGSEIQSAVAFYEVLATDPSPANKVAPLDFRFAFGVTPWVQNGNATAIGAILTLFGNLILTGQEGGLASQALIRNGTTMDGNQMMFWYAVDWTIINCAQALAADVIDGSNRQPPLYYNQFGINELQTVAQGQVNTAVTDGLLLNGSVTAVTFAAYVAANPDDYAHGIYKGLKATVTPQVGFTQITFFLDAVAFAA